MLSPTVKPLEPVDIVESTVRSRTKTLQILNDKWCGLSKESKRMIVLFEELEDLSSLQITLLINRYISITESIQHRTHHFAIQFHVGRTIITVGSLFVSALLSIQYIHTGGASSPSNTPSPYFWITWLLSLLVTICNGVLTLFKVDKKYYFLNTTMESIKSEAWQYLYLTGKYGGHYTKGRVPSHENQYVFFCHNLEKIKLKQVEEEYYKLIDSNDAADKDKQHTTHLMNMKSISGNEFQQYGKTSRNIAGLYMPTPEQQQLLDHQQTLANALVQNGTNLHPQVDGTSIQKKNEPAKDSHS